PPAQHAAADLRGLVPRVRDQGADVPVPYVAAGRAHRGTNRWFGAVGRDPVETRHTRVRSTRAADAARCCEELGTMDRTTRDYRHHLWRARLSRAARYEAPDRVLV